MKRTGAKAAQAVNGITLTFCLSLLSCAGGRGEKYDYQGKVAENPTVSYAKGFEIVNRNYYSQIIIKNPWQGAEGVTMTWYLVPYDYSPPEGTDPSSVIRVPVKKIVCMSTTHVAMVSVLGETESLVGISGTNFIYEQQVRGKIENGTIMEIGFEDNLNKERLIILEPDIVMAYGVGSESSAYAGKLTELGIKTLFNADYLETHPLGKAEWIKLFGALYCKENAADSIFRNIEKEYNDLKSFIRFNAKDPPDVLMGLPFRDAWFISPGNSYVSILISDAGGKYLWRDIESSVSMPYGIEDVYLRALKADYWLNIGSVGSKQEIISIDTRLADLPCFKNGNLYNNNQRLSVGGGNDYWESGTLNPHIILKDIASLLHAELFHDHKLVYYKRIE
ncbi:MAG: ABC transporter substrate-binding protein [Bacteroidales bacterium]|jgi:iron complex transport system substrate-binding protein|nr:ABC transporter substrate-binding protein [Bacteroidales bacterium]